MGIEQRGEQRVEEKSVIFGRHVHEARENTVFPGRGCATDSVSARGLSAWRREGGSRTFF